MDLIGSIDQALPAILEVLRSMPHTPTNHMSSVHTEAVRKVWQAVDETKMFLVAARSGEANYNKPNPKLVTLWSEASLAIASIDEDLARRLRMKAEYWSDPTYWTSEQVVKARIAIDEVAVETRSLLEKLPVSTISANPQVQYSMGSSSNTVSQTQPIDILLLCALKDEFDEVLAVSDGIITPGWCHDTDNTGRIIANARFTGKNGAELSIRATWAGYMGREQTQAVASSIICSTPVKCLAMSGICAGRRGKVELGDVIFGERLWSYDSGKSIVESGNEVFQYDMLQYRPSEVWVQHMQAVSFATAPSWMAERPRLTHEYQENWVLQCLLTGKDPKIQSDFENECPDWPEVLKRLMQKGWVLNPLKLSDQGKSYIEELCFHFPQQLPRPAGFQIHVAPIATGGAVKEDEQLFSKLSLSMRKVLGVEMEASGLAALAEAHRIPAIIAKGVSDFGDKFKDDRYRKFAARASAEALILLLRNSSELLQAGYVIPTRITRTSPDPTFRVGEQILPLDLIDFLADQYPDVPDARALWERAGGKRREVENISHPRDLWQRIWIRSTQGAVVTPQALLNAVLDEYPGNEIVKKYVGKSML